MATEFRAGVPVDDLPKRLREGRPVNLDGAKALLGIISKAGATATDGILYDDAVKCRAKAGAAKRLLGHVTDPKSVKTRAYPDGKGWRWVVFLAVETPVEAPQASE